MAQRWANLLKFIEELWGELSPPPFLRAQPFALVLQLAEVIVAVPLVHFVVELVDNLLMQLMAHVHCLVVRVFDHLTVGERSGIPREIL